jgi:hypothetical protein
MACINFIFNYKPVFDEEPFHDLTTTSSIDDFHPNTNMVDLDVTCSPVASFSPSSTSTIVDESVLFPNRVAAPLSIPDIKHSDVEVGASAKCSTKCLNSGIEPIFVPEPTQQKCGGSKPPAVSDPPPLITCMVFNIYCSIEGGHRWLKELFHEDLGLLIPVEDGTTAPKVKIQSVIYGIVVVDDFDCKFWDPG